jgi:hypothetical protein
MVWAMGFGGFAEYRAQVNHDLFRENQGTPILLILRLHVGM